MLAHTGRAPWLTACETQSKADGLGETITAAAKDTYNSHRFKDITLTITGKKEIQYLNVHYQRLPEPPDLILGNRAPTPPDVHMSTCPHP